MQQGRATKRGPSRPLLASHSIHMLEACTGPLASIARCCHEKPLLQRVRWPHPIRSTSSTVKRPRRPVNFQTPVTRRPRHAPSQKLKQHIAAPPSQYFLGLVLEPPMQPRRLQVVAGTARYASSSSLQTPHHKCCSSAGTLHTTQLVPERSQD